MRTRRVITHVYLFVLTLLLWTTDGRCDTSLERPARAIWLVLDSVRQDHLHFAGYKRETSPTLDRLAGEGVAFDWAIAPGNMTHISVPMFFTGRYFSQLFEQPLTHGTVWLPPWPTTVSETFRDAGIRSLAWTANRTIGLGSGCERGFLEYHLVVPRSKLVPSVDEVIRAIRHDYSPSEKPEFVYVHLQDAHLPYAPPYPYERLFSKEYKRDVVQNGALLDDEGKYIVSNEPYFSQRHDLTDEDLEFLIGQYDGAIRYLDESLPALLEALHYDKLRDLLIITADHGDQFFEHGYWGHGHCAFPEEVRVPLIFHWQGFKPRLVNQPVSLTDIYPTLCDIFGLPKPSNIEGQSLLPLMQGGPETERYVFTEVFDAAGLGGSVVGPDYFYSLNTQAYRKRPWQIWPFREYLFDIRKDPGCKVNLFGQKNAEADRVNDILRKLNARFIAFTPEKLRGTDESIALGPNLFAMNDDGTPKWEDVHPAVNANGNALTLRGAASVARLKTGETEYRPYVFSCDVAVISAPVTLKIVCGETTAFEYAVHRPVEKLPLHVIVGIRPGGAELRVFAGENGEGHVSNPKLCAASMPLIKVVPWKVSGEGEQAPEAELDDQEKAALRALGYGG
jgi:arylsulfatase A-like enzyme